MLIGRKDPSADSYSPDRLRQSEMQIQPSASHDLRKPSVQTDVPTIVRIFAEHSDISDLMTKFEFCCPPQ